MDITMILAVVAVLSAWGITALALRRWGPGRARRRTRCPRSGKQAKVMVEQKEAGFASLAATDVVSCSLFSGAPLTCEKECLRRL